MVGVVVREWGRLEEAALEKQKSSPDRSIIHYIIGWMMVFTGLMYPYSGRISFVGMMADAIGESGLLLWSVLMIGFGATLILRHDRRYTFLLTSPLLLLVMLTMKLAVDGRSLTAMIYYVSIWLFPNYFDYRKLAVGTRWNWRARLIFWVSPKWIFSSILLLMFGVLWILPHGSGLDYTYRYLQFTGDPVTAYRVLFGVCGFGLLLPSVTSRTLISLLCIPMWVHGGILVVVIATETFAWAFLPLFFGNSLLWLSAIEEA